MDNFFIAFSGIVMSIWSSVTILIRSKGSVTIAMCLASLSIGILFIFIGFTNKHPKAIDVYRGNTELKITSVNGIPTDSVVVFTKK